MTLRDDPIPYDAWVAGVFGQPESGRFFDARLEGWQHRIDSTLTARYLARLFRGPSRLDAFTDVQIGRGLWALAGWDGMGCLRFEPPPDAQRADTVDTVPDLYLRIYEPRCVPGLSTRNHNSNEINSAAYMLWEVCPMCPGISWLFPDEEGLRALDLGLTRLLAELLQIVENPASQESILHGLGQAWIPGDEGQEVEHAIDAFLRRPDLRVDNRAHARLAKSGGVQ